MKERLTTKELWHGDEKEGDEEESKEGCCTKETEEVADVGRGNHMELLVIPIPRGWTVIVQFDPISGSVKTNCAGVSAAFFQKGVQGWDGRLLFPKDGRAFLEAVYDRLFLSGYAVRWLKSAAISHFESR